MGVRSSTGAFGEGAVRLVLCELNNIIAGEAIAFKEEVGIVLLEVGEGEGK